MTESKHTPDPWKYVLEWAGTSGSTIYITTEEFSEICTMAADTKEDLANARLIAASPKLLKALENVDMTLTILITVIKAVPVVERLAESLISLHQEVISAIKEAKGE